MVSAVLYSGCSTGDKHSKTGTEKINQVTKEGLKQGPWEIYEDSLLISKGSYLNGLPDGMWTYWYKNGQMKAEGPYTEGIKYGMWVEWYEDGEIMWKGEYDNGRREFELLEQQAKISFIEAAPKNNILAVDSVYHLRIRIPNIPASNLFVEASSGEISRTGNSDVFVLKTSNDTIFTLAIGYIPDLDFKDFRNLISEIDFKLR